MQQTTVKCPQCGEIHTMPMLDISAIDGIYHAAKLGMRYVGQCPQTLRAVYVDKDGAHADSLTIEKLAPIGQPQSEQRLPLDMTGLVFPPLGTGMHFQVEEVPESNGLLRICQEPNDEQRARGITELHVSSELIKIDKPEPDAVDKRPMFTELRGCSACGHNHP